MTSLNRLALAFIIAPLAAPLVWTVVIALDEASSFSDFMSMLTMALIMGSQLAYAVMFLIGAPAYYILDRIGRLTLSAVLVIGLLTGAGAMYWLFGEEGVIAAAGLGALCGAAAAILFWIIARPKSPPSQVAA